MHGRGNPDAPSTPGDTAREDLGNQASSVCRSGDALEHAVSGESPPAGSAADSLHGSGDESTAAAQADMLGVLGVDTPVKLVLVGLPNAGKSTLLNRLLGFERALVGPEAALTRDAISEPLTWRGTRFEVTDTAGWLQRATLKSYDESGGDVARMTVAQVRAAAHVIIPSAS